MVINTRTQTETKETLMFYISRSRTVKGKPQLRLGEYGGMSDTGEVKALATCHLGWGFLSGMFSTYRDDEGNLYRSIERNEGDLAQTFFTIQINFSAAMLEKLETSISKEMKEVFAKPPRDDQGNSALKGYQLQVDLCSGSMARIQMERDDQKAKKMVIILDPSEVEDIRVVTSSDEGYIRGGHRVPTKNLMKTLLKGQQSRKEDTLEGTEALLRELHSDPEGKYTKDKRKRARRAAESASEGSTAASKSKEQEMD